MSSYSLNISLIISLTLCIFDTIPEIWPAISEPLSVSPSITAFLKAPFPSSSSSLILAWLSSSFKYSLASLFLRTWTGCPVHLPVTTVSISLALITASL